MASDPARRLQALASPTAGAAVAGARGLTISGVLALLRPEFPDITVSKIRFLEDQGLVQPRRTASGYRKFGPHDVERLRHVLGLQRDHYLPLRVIRDQLSRQSDESVPVAAHQQLVSAEQLAATAPAAPQLLSQLLEHGVIQPDHRGMFHADAVAVFQAAAQLGEFGIEPRHLRAFRSAAQRQADLLEQVITPLRRQRSAGSDEHAHDVAQQLASTCTQLHEALLRSALRRCDP